MKRSAIMAAQVEARRFLDRSTEFWRVDMPMQAKRAGNQDDFIYDRSLEAAALKRASMDLSRALSKLRGG